jgi:hypothetical protein
MNNIGDQGAQYLAKALETNKVRKYILSFIASMSLSLNTDAYNVEDWMEWN